MRCAAVLLVLTLGVSACGLYGPPIRAHEPDEDHLYYDPNQPSAAPAPEPTSTP